MTAPSRMRTLVGPPDPLPGYPARELAAQLENAGDRPVSQSVTRSKIGRDNIQIGSAHDVHLGD